MTEYPTDVGNAHVIDRGLFLEMQEAAKDWHRATGRPNQERPTALDLDLEDWRRYDGELL